MEHLASIKDLDYASMASSLQTRGQQALDVAKAHPWITGGIVAGVAVVWRYLSYPRNLPPGPMNYPLIGAPCSLDVATLPDNMLQWRNRYGEIVSFYRTGRLNILLNSERVIREAFSKRGEEFAHRASLDQMPELQMFDEIMAAPYDETWKRNKKAAVSAFKLFGFGTPKSEAKLHEQIDLFEEFLAKANGAPLDVTIKLRLFAAAITASTMWGGETSWDDPDLKELITQTEAWFQEWSNCAGSFSMLNEIFRFPFLAGILTSGDRKKLKEQTTEMMGFLTRKLSEVSTAGLSEREPEHVADAFFKEKGMGTETVEILARNLNIILSDTITTAATVDQWCLLYIALYPEVQKQLHAQIDAVCGQARRPTMADWSDIPYAQAIMLETVRLLDIVPISQPRHIKHDIQFEGFTIPKDTLVAANFYGVHFDPEIFPDPHRFKPSRFFDKLGKFDTSLANKIFAFSTGTRKCIGEPYYKAHGFLFLTRVFQRYEIEFDPSAPKPTMKKDTSHVINKPQDHKFCFKTR